MIPVLIASSHVLYVAKIAVASVSERPAGIAHKCPKPSAYSVTRSNVESTEECERRNGGRERRIRIIDARPAATNRLAKMDIVLTVLHKQQIASVQRQECVNELCD